MSIQSQIAPINGSMNYDNAGKYVRTEQGQVISRINLRSNSKDGKRYHNEKIKGNLLISTTLPKGVNKTIGTCNDYKNDAIMYFIYNSNNNHCVMRYFINTKTIQKVWYSESGLGFENTFLQAAVAEGMVYWVNGDQQPKSFQIERAVKFMKVLYNGETISASERYTSNDAPFDDNIFSLIKTPPQFAPLCIYDSDINYNFNNLRKKLFQFKYAYLYKNDQISSWSAISKVPLPINEIASNGQFIDDITKNNIINVTYNSGTHDVKSILLATKDSSLRNQGSFWQFEEIKKYNEDTGVQLIDDDSDEEISFYNNKHTINIDTDINNRYSDHVPLSGDDIILFDDKYLGITYPKSGYDKVTTNYNLSAFTEAIDTEEELRVFTDMVVKNSIITIQGCTLVFQPLDWIDIPLEFYPNSFYNISFKVPFIDVNVSFTVPTGNTDSNYPQSVRDQFLIQMRTYFNTNYPALSSYIEDKSSSSPRGIALGFSLITTGCPPLTSAINLKGNVTSSLATVIPTAYKSLKKGQFHPFALIYNDKGGRYNIVYGDEEVYSPLPADNSDDELKKRVLCQWTISHKPPDQAKTYRWAYIRNKSYSSFKYFAYVKSTLGTGVEEGGNGIPINRYFIELNQSLQRIRDRLPNFIIPDYTWINGDRIRVIGEDESYEVLSEFTWTVENTGKVGFLVDIPLTTHASVGGYEIGYISLVEVYRTNPSPQETVYLEIGEEFEIREDSNGNKYHSVYKNNSVIPDNHINQEFDANGNLTVAASGIMDFGDVYLRQRPVIDENGNILLPVIESEYFNDYYRSDAIDTGREGAKINSEQKYLNRVVRSENFLENTEYNLLNVWLPSPFADYFDASDLYGKITGIQESGDVLKIVQEHKETSVYVGKILAKESGGKDIYLDSENVFGTNLPFIERRGSKYIHSIKSNNRYLYYFDDITGEFIRSAPNGQLAISSEYHMQNWFEKKAKELREYSGEKDVIVSCDNDYDDVIISFVIGDEIETIVFYEKEGEARWDHFVTYKTNTKKPELFSFHGDTLVSFLEGKLYLHNEGTNNTFYGQLHECSLKYAANSNPLLSKRYSNIRISSDKNIWDVEFTTGDMVNYVSQKSILKPSIIEEINGRLHAQILKNIIDRNSYENTELLHNGHDMVGEVLFVELSNNDNSSVELGEVEVKYYINR